MVPGEGPPNGVQPAGEAATAVDYSKPGPFTAMRLPKLEHTASSAFPACVSSQCLLRITAFYPKAKGPGHRRAAPHTDDLRSDVFTFHSSPDWPGAVDF